VRRKNGHLGIHIVFSGLKKYNMVPNAMTAIMIKAFLQVTARIIEVQQKQISLQWQIYI
jgi:hypothetical protein